MGWTEAVVKVVTGLAWPIVAVVIVFVLRRELGRLIARMTHLKGPAGVEADFASQAAATNELSEEAVPNAPGEMMLSASEDQDWHLTPPASLTLRDLLREAEMHPVGAVVRAWNVVEDVAGRNFGFGPGRVKYPIPTTARSLQKQGVFSDDLVGVAERLSRLRAGVVHGQETPDKASARDFVEAAWRLAIAFEGAPPNPVTEEEKWDQM